MISYSISNTGALDNDGDKGLLADTGMQQPLQNTPFVAIPINPHDLAKIITNNLSRKSLFQPMIKYHYNDQILLPLYQKQNNIIKNIYKKQIWTKSTPVLQAEFNPKLHVVRPFLRIPTSQFMVQLTFKTSDHKHNNMVEKKCWEISKRILGIGRQIHKDKLQMNETHFVIFRHLRSPTNEEIYTKPIMSSTVTEEDIRPCIYIYPN